ncbi:hypothetical protein ACPCUX_09515 [Cellulosimicrobium sp. AB352]
MRTVPPRRRSRRAGGATARAVPSCPRCGARRTAHPRRLVGGVV